MIQPNDSLFLTPASVRDGRLVAVTCASCGCRLDAAETGRTAHFRHFGALGGRDASGCRVACVDALHDVSGRALS
jgi:hypothetical protein